MSKYLMKSAAAIVLGLAAAACSHDLDIVEKAEQQSLDNAQSTLGFYIPEDQDWKMSSEASVNVTIPGDANETYTVMIFANNPLEDGIGYYMTKQNLKGGQNLVTDVAYPMHLTSLVIGITDSNGKTTYKSAKIENRKVTSLNDISAARTRATGEFANHVGAYPDANMWTSKGFLAPDPLTHAQKLRAQYYFQMNKITNPNQPDNGQIDFFMQQVYDGGDDPMAGKSLEKYPSADFTPGSNNYITSGEHMDHLTCGPDHTHTFNFNNGNCSTNDNVANRDQTDVNDTNQQHSDQIQLMLNTKTSCFGYANSDASYVRDDRWTLVSATTIDNFCDNDPGFASWLASKLNEGEVDKKCDDEFHRSFIGFDFDMLPDEHVFAGTEQWEDGNASNNWQRIYKGKTYAEYDYYRYDLYGPTYHYLSANGNQYCGESQTIDPEPSQERALELMRQGWLPATGSANKRWIKVGGCADGYYSDWIVTFKPADSGTIIINHDPLVWSYAFEDNSYSCDFDMNDVVLRVNVNKDDDTMFDVTLVAAGCEYDNYVFLGDQLITWDGKAEVHDALGASKGQMVNTGRGVTKTPVTTQVPIPNGDTAENAHFKIWPYKKNGVYGNTADQKESSAINVSQLEGKGKAPLGIVVPGKWAWPKERIVIVDAYSQFVKWATNVVHVEDTNNPDTDWYDYPTTGKVVVIQ